MTAYYNEIDPYAADWLRNLIAAGHIAPGVVDTRSIEDVHPADLQDFTQCHFFAGIGVWSLALRRAGWSDDRPVWTGSCPCQPFSAAGQGAGFADERHLWPAFHHLIRQRRPAVVLGEQVASKDADPWIDLVQDDMEGLGYRVGAIPFPSAGVGAPHIRDRLYWVADTNLRKSKQPAGKGSGPDETQSRWARCKFTGCGDASRVADHHQHRRITVPERELHDAEHHTEPCGVIRGLGDAACTAGQRHAGSVPGAEAQVNRQGRADGRINVGPEHAGPGMGAGQPGPTNGFWRAADWLSCRDGRWRPVEPGTFPLVDGAPARVGRLRAYGNAINAEAARVFIQAVMECQP